MRMHKHHGHIIIRIWGSRIRLQLKPTAIWGSKPKETPLQIKAALTPRLRFIRRPASPKPARISTTLRSKWTTSSKTNSTPCFSLKVITLRSTFKVSQNFKEFSKVAAYWPTTTQAHLSLGESSCPKMWCRLRSSSLGKFVWGNSQRREIREGLRWKGARIPRVFQAKNLKLKCSRNFNNDLCQQVTWTRILSVKIFLIDQAFSKCLIRIKHLKAFLIRKIYKIRSDPTTCYNSQKFPFFRTTIISSIELERSGTKKISIQKTGGNNAKRQAIATATRR